MRKVNFPQPDLWGIENRLVNTMASGEVFVRLLRTDLGIIRAVDEAARRRPAPVGVVFDGDDTLWSTEPLYDDARQAAASVVSKAGLDPLVWERLERRIDVQNAATLGHSVDRFPTSCVQAYRDLRELNRHAFDARVATVIKETAASVFHQLAPLMPGVRETLSALRGRGYKLALLTKGDEAVQERRIEHSGLRPYFDIVRIVSEKTTEAIKAVVKDLGVDPPSAWMVGNSMRSDVLPALAAGVQAVWINAHVWEYERSHDHLVDHRVLTVDRIDDLLTVIAA